MFPYFSPPKIPGYASRHEGSCQIEMMEVRDRNRGMVAEKFAGLGLHGSFRKRLAVYSPGLKNPCLHREGLSHGARPTLCGKAAFTEVRGRRESRVERFM